MNNSFHNRIYTAFMTVFVIFWKVLIRHSFEVSLHNQSRKVLIGVMSSCDHSMYVFCRNIKYFRMLPDHAIGNFSCKFSYPHVWWYLLNARWHLIDKSEGFSSKHQHISTKSSSLILRHKIGHHYIWHMFVRVHIISINIGIQLHFRSSIISLYDSILLMMINCSCCFSDI